MAYEIGYRAWELGFMKNLACPNKRLNILTKLNRNGKVVNLTSILILLSVHIY
jgi:hypothetical protein